MKKIFDAPEIRAAQLDVEDIMTASELVGANSAKLGKAEDPTPVSSELWKGTDESWVD